MIQYPVKTLAPGATILLTNFDDSGTMMILVTGLAGGDSLIAIGTSRNAAALGNTRVFNYIDGSLASATGVMAANQAYFIDMAGVTKLTINAPGGNVNTATIKATSSQRQRPHV